MRLAHNALVLALTCSVLFAGKKADTKQKELEAWAKSLDKESVHKAVMAAELDLLGEVADKTRPVLVVYFEDLDYDVCLDLVGSLLDAKDKLSRAVFWQFVFASGDFVVQHPDQATEKYAYMLAGLESALRGYEHVLDRKPREKRQFLDELLALRTEGRLGEHIRANMCAKN
ncbi:MAG TPA: hypothetical protein VGK94_05425 [Candidatus Polarisedimenticolia bacterium]|jgi:hypothetical protein